MGLSLPLSLPKRLQHDAGQVRVQPALQENLHLRRDHHGRRYLLRADVRPGRRRDLRADEPGETLETHQTQLRGKGRRWRRRRIMRMLAWFCGRIETRRLSSERCPVSFLDSTATTSRLGNNTWTMF